MNIPTTKLLTVVAVCIGIGAIIGVAGYLLDLGGAVTGGVGGAICAVAAFLLLRRPSR